MTVFKSRQVSLDKEPWLCDYEIDGKPVRSFFDGHGRYTWAPRPEFEPTRDPEPWLETWGPNTGARYGHYMWVSLTWAPRREQFDTPVNRVLVLFRRDAEHNGIDSALEYDWPTNSVASSAEEIDHARRVLRRLANWKEQ